MSILEIGSKFGASHWDVVKLDCEGAEYDVLLDWPGPIAEQITVEFHEHTGANVKGPDVYREILEQVGFNKVEIFFKSLNFTGFICIK